MYSNEDLQALILQHGLGSCVETMDSKKIRDENIADLWQEATNILEQIKLQVFIINGAETPPIQ